jgi:hypothetical protein
MINLGSDARRQAAIAAALPQRLIAGVARLVAAISHARAAPTRLTTAADDGGGSEGASSCCMLGGGEVGWTMEEEAMWEAEQQVTHFAASSLQPCFGLGQSQSEQGKSGSESVCVEICPFD